MTNTFPNPWRNKPGFIDLGTIAWTDQTLITHRHYYYELYALLPQAGRQAIDLGARYGAEPHQYLSGAVWPASQLTPWEIPCLSRALAVAAARLFANHGNRIP